MPSPVGWVRRRAASSVKGGAALHRDVTQSPISGIIKLQPGFPVCAPAQPVEVDAENDEAEHWGSIESGGQAECRMDLAPCCSPGSSTWQDMRVHRARVVRCRGTQEVAVDGSQAAGPRRKRVSDCPLVRLQFHRRCGGPRVSRRSGCRSIPAVPGGCARGTRQQKKSGVTDGDGVCLGAVEFQTRFPPVAGTNTRPAVRPGFAFWKFGSSNWSGIPRL